MNKIFQKYWTRVVFTVLGIALALGLVSGMPATPAKAAPLSAGLCASYVNLTASLSPRMDGVRHWGSVYYLYNTPNYSPLVSQGKAHIWYLNENGSWIQMSLDPWDINIWGVHTSWYVLHPQWLMAGRWRLYMC